MCCSKLLLSLLVLLLFVCVVVDLFVVVLRVCLIVCLCVCLIVCCYSCLVLLLLPYSKLTNETQTHATLTNFMNSIVKLTTLHFTIKHTEVLFKHEQLQVARFLSKQPFQALNY